MMSPVHTSTPDPTPVSARSTRVDPGNRPFRRGSVSLLVALGFAFVGLSAGSSLAASGAGRGKSDSDKVSYHREIRPLFQGECHGCHQPAKAKGDYVMTDPTLLRKPGASGEAPLIPGKPDASLLLRQITPASGKAEMPKGKPPLSDQAIDLVRRWIAEGAEDDTPAHAGTRIDAEHPPVYTTLPAVTALDYSPDGRWLAVAGFHEVLLHASDGSRLEARLVGLSERIQSIRFSPDGRFLAVAGGLPARMGEIQIWEVASRQLKVSVPVGYDTVYGVNWSPDGRLVSFGCPDKTVRAIEAESGRQVLQQMAHEDWVLDTVFSTNGSHVISVGRDMTAKLTEVATQRFIDNITSITPGALRGGLSSVARHPTRDEVLVGGADGRPQIFQVFRQAARKIGDNATLLRRFPEMEGRIFAVDYCPDGKVIGAAASLDGRGAIHLYAAEFDPTLPPELLKAYEKTSGEYTPQEREAIERFTTAEVKLLRQVPVPTASVYSLAFSPDGRRIAAGTSVGVIHLVDADSGRLDAVFAAAPLEDALEGVGSGRLAGTSTGTGTDRGAASGRGADYLRDVSPILSRLGCNAGTCHGSKEGKNGFKLSLRGYDPVFDVRSLTDDIAARRINPSAPDQSLMLLKATGAVPHEGGARTPADSEYYAVLRQWIADGARLDLATPRVTRIELQPSNPLLEKIGSTMSMRVIATYADGLSREVTAEAFLESGNTDVATTGVSGLVTSLRRGEAPLLARYEGSYAATTLTVMGDRSGFVWQDPPIHNRIDELVAAKWKRMMILPSPLSDDATFLRRVSLDLTGLPPTADEVREFLANPRDTRSKRDALIERLLGSPAYIEHWANKWADLLQVNRKFLGEEGARAFRDWIRSEIAANTPYDEFVRKLLTASGSNRENPAAAYWKILRAPTEAMENSTHLFLAIRFNCNKCHDHPFERWTQDQYYHLSQYFAQVHLRKDDASGDRRLGGTAVEEARPLFEIVEDKPEGAVKHDRTGKEVPPAFPFAARTPTPAPSSATPTPTRRAELAAWMTSTENRYFAASYVNRLWGYLLGVGLIEPLDDIRAGNPPSNPELLDHLTREFIESGFNTRHVLRQICQSRTYQLALETHAWNADDTVNFSHALPRRLPAEVLFDSVQRVTGAPIAIPGAEPGLRAAQLVDSAVDVPGGLLATLGRPPRESACECERSNDIRLTSVLSLLSGPAIAQAIHHPASHLARLAETETDDRRLANELFLCVLNRPAGEAELPLLQRAASELESEHTRLREALARAEAEWRERRPQLERDRSLAIERAEKNLAYHLVDRGPKIAAAQRARSERIAAAEAAIRDHQAEFEARLAAWEAAISPPQLALAWIPLEPKSAQGSGSAQVHKLADGTLRSTASVGELPSFTVTAETAVTNITGIRLEVLPDAELPGFGPGHAGGDFVLAEFVVESASRTNAEKFARAGIRASATDRIAEGYRIEQVHNGIAEQGRPEGWRLGGEVGRPHWAAFALEKPLGTDTNGLVLRFSLHHRYEAPWEIGRFRLWIATHENPTAEGLPAGLAAILRTPAAQRTPAQRDALAAYFRSRDPEALRREFELALARQPLPEDSRLAELELELARAARPVPVDPALLALRHDVELSTRQLAHPRLTAVQDLAWALINTPAFLFNR